MKKISTRLGEWPLRLGDSQLASREDERMSLYDVFEAAVDGKLPAQDGQVEVVGDDCLKTPGVIAFPAHFYVLAPVEPEWVHALLPPGDFNAPLGPRFLTSLADQLGAEIGASDAVLAARAHGRGDDLGLREVAGSAHPRVERARWFRDDLQVWETRDGAGCLVLGRGVAGRWEVAFEVEPAARRRGLGRGLAVAALGLLPAGTPVFAQVSPGNSTSLRATLAAGFVPIGGEVLLFSSRTAGARD